MSQRTPLPMKDETHRGVKKKKTVGTLACRIEEEEEENWFPTFLDGETITAGVDSPSIIHRDRIGGRDEVAVVVVCSPNRIRQCQTFLFKI